MRVLTCIIKQLHWFVTYSVDVELSRDQQTKPGINTKVKYV